MLVRSKHIQFNFEKHRKTSQEVEDAVQTQGLSQNDAESLLSPERFRPFIQEVGKRCFHCCGDLQQLPAVMWHGHNPTTPEPEPLEIWFHPGCVEKFVQLLLRDANEVSLGKEEADEILHHWKSWNKEWKNWDQ
ncbi:hypothetical protein [Nitrosospira sp. NpAV]|uniref:hypothetical protein n=1 Tax=Nitrosospira sp. NpAV TaxID=58133 RepID=UPI0005A23163|nr:hypothetical protein [Nitrosospira sp. NpAV]KIO49584.1 hypothetical protein SQ11_05490 [Nitrosospira sp. NpAV]